MIVLGRGEPASASVSGVRFRFEQSSELIIEVN